MSISPARGSITTITGCMWAGKTTEFLRRINRHRIAGNKVLLIKPAGDTRSGGDISSHRNPDGQNVYTEAIEIQDFSEIKYNWLEDADVIGIDEANFFNEDIVDFCDNWANQGKEVIVAGLNGTFQRQHFGFLHLLYPKAEYHVHLTAICMICKKEGGSFTFRKTEDEKERIVGGAETYQVLCRNCFNVEKLKQVQAAQGQPK